MVFGDVEMYLMKQLKETLMKPPSKRTAPEIAVLASTAKLSFFDDFKKEHGEAQLHELLKTAYYE